MVHLEGFPLALPITAWLPYRRPAAWFPRFVDAVFQTDLPAGGDVAVTPLRGGTLGASHRLSPALAQVHY